MHRPFLGAIPLAILAGCGGTPANQPAPAAPGQPSAQTPPAPPRPGAGDITISTPDARTEVRSGTAAAPYPDGIPRYPGATADQSVSVSGASAQNSGRILGFRTNDQAAQVIAFYAEAAGRAGYRVVGRLASGPNATLILQRGAENVSISASRVGTFTQGQIIVAGPAPGQ
jgi:hypothetical protein